MAITLFICGDMEINSGPKNTKSCYFSLSHWNINSLPAHDFSKLSKHTIQNTILICLSETYLDSSYADDDTQLNLKDFALIRADNPHNRKKGGVDFIYFKERLVVHSVSPLNLNKCLVLEINIQNKKGFVISLYRSPNQGKDEFDKFLLNFEQRIFDRMSQYPHFISVTVDFNVRSSSWWKNNLTTSEGNQVDAVSSSYGLSQLICEPTYILPNSSSCIDTIFIIQNNFIMDSGVHASLHPHCHYQIVYAKLNLKIEYPSLYELLVWHYKKTNTQLLNHTIETFNWEKLLENKNINEQLYLFNKTMLIIFHNFIPNKNIICNDKDLLGLTTKLKHRLKRKIIFLKAIWLIVDWPWIVSVCKRQVQN